MRSRTSSRFRRQFWLLPKKARQRAKEAYRLFETNPGYRSLRFKKVGDRRYSVRFYKKDRALARKTDEGNLIWYSIGSHATYAQDIKNKKLG